jgi:hypothetical protein
VISYSIVFDSLADKQVWVDFANWLKRQYPDLTVGERIHRYVGDIADKALAETEEI